MALRELLLDEMRDLYSAENQLLKALPKLARGAETPAVKELITTHLEETKGQVERLKQIFDSLGEKSGGKFCKGMQGLIAEGQEALEEDYEGAVFDLGISGASLRVEHYEIAGYTASIEMAKALGLNDAVDLLTQNLQEEQATAEKILAGAGPLIQQATAEPEEDDEEESSGGSASKKSGAKKSSAKKSGAKKSSAKKASAKKAPSKKAAAKGGRR